MKEIIQHPTYGEIVYTEGFWSGKKTLTVGGVEAKKVSKKEFTFDGKKVSIKGNYYAGTSLDIEGEIIQVTPKPKWYEIVIAVLPLIFLLTWGNSVALCSIFPVVGGALGGALGAVALCVTLSLMKKTKSFLVKLIYGLCVFAVTILIAYALALAILSSLA